MKSFLTKVLTFVLALIVLAGLAITPVAALDVSEQYPTDENSPLKDLTICFYGDSICSANCERDTEYSVVRGWAGRIGAVSGCTYYNFGVSGASVSSCRNGNTIIAQLKQTKSQGIVPDVIVLHGGVNDAWDAVDAGEISDGFLYQSKYNPSTFAPALEQVLSYIEDTFPKAEICFVINFEFLNAQMGERLMDMDEYVDTTIEICEKWDIPYLDLYYNEEVVNALHPYTTNSYGGKSYQNTYLYDFVHPSTAGYDVLYTYIYDFLVELIDPTYGVEPEPEPQPEPEPEPEIEEKPEQPEEDTSDEVLTTGASETSNGIVPILVAVAAVVVAGALVAIVLTLKKKNPAA